MTVHAPTWQLLESSNKDREKFPEPVCFDASAVYALHEEPAESLRRYFHAHPGGLVFCEQFAQCLECALDLFADKSRGSCALLGTLGIARHEAAVVLCMLRIGIPICYRIQDNYVQRILSETECDALEEGLMELWGLDCE